MPITGTDDLLILEDSPDQLGYYDTLRRISPEHSELWRVEPPEGSVRDAWVAVRIEADEVVANSWSCWCVRIDLGTGAERARTFTK